MTVETMTGRLVEGTLSAVNPGYFHTFGNPIPELVHVGVDLRARLAEYHAARPPRVRGGRKAVSLMATRFDAIMARRGEIMLSALGMDYSEFERSPIAFDYEGMMAAHGYSLQDIVGIQTKAGVGDTPRCSSSRT